MNKTQAQAMITAGQLAAAEILAYPGEPMTWLDQRLAELRSVEPPAVLPHRSIAGPSLTAPRLAPQQSVTRGIDPRLVVEIRDNLHNSQTTFPRILDGLLATADPNAGPGAWSSWVDLWNPPNHRLRVQATSALGYEIFAVGQGRHRTMMAKAFRLPYYPCIVTESSPPQPGEIVQLSIDKHFDHDHARALQRAGKVARAWTGRHSWDAKVTSAERIDWFYDAPDSVAAAAVLFDHVHPGVLKENSLEDMLLPTRWAHHFDPWRPKNPGIRDSLDRLRRQLLNP